MIFEILSTYGWYLLAISLIFYYLWNKYSKNLKISPILKHDQREIDSELAFKRNEAMLLARQKMQEEVDRKAVLHKEKMNEMEKLKRQQIIDDWEKHEKGLGYRSKSKTNDSETPTTGSCDKKKKPRLRDNDFSPLMGGSSGGTYRPARSSNTGGGG